MKNVLIISTSIRAGSNSEIVAHSFENGALSSGNNVEFLSLKGKRIEFCRGCMACSKNHVECVIHDDMDEMRKKVHDADVLVFATPIYYYEMSGIMKTFIDRCNPLYDGDYKFTDVYLICTAAEEGEEVMSRAINGLGGFIECYPRSTLKGVVNATGVNEMCEVKARKDILDSAYQMGASIS